jgi:hypothetical protein
VKCVCLAWSLSARLNKFPSLTFLAQEAGVVLLHMPFRLAAPANSRTPYLAFVIGYARNLGGVRVTSGLPGVQYQWPLGCST